MVFNTLIDSSEMSSEEYHGTEGTWSSSQLKSMLQDPEVFHKKYILKQEERVEIDAFAIGTYFHTGLLEPHKLQEDTCVFQGAVRRGAEYDKFKEESKGKAIVTKAGQIQAEKLIQAVKESPISMGFLNSSRPEVSAFIEVFVMGKEIFAFRNEQCFCLAANGWVPTSLDYDEEDIKDFGVRLVLKVRADALGVDTGVISDLKSTSGNTKKAHEMQTKVASFEYDLSAALYLDVFSLATGEDFHTFVWIFASKDVGNACSWKASDKNMMVGRAKWKKAVVELAKYITNDWAFVDELGTLEAPHYSLTWLED